MSRVFARCGIDYRLIIHLKQTFQIMITKQIASLDYKQFSIIILETSKALKLPISKLITVINQTKPNQNTIQRVCSCETVFLSIEKE